jgi:ABC-2 type transport system permease protein
MMAVTAAKYVAFARVGAVRARREPGEIYGRILFFAVVLGVFSSLWRAVAEAGLAIAADPAVLVWYVAVTEWILLSAPPIYLDMQETIRRGDVACQMNRPVSFAGAALAEGIGLLAVRLPALGVVAFVCAWLFTGAVPPGSALVRAVPFVVGGAVLLTTLYAWIGLLAFWLDDVLPLYWVWQKLLFVLGGLMLPIQLYPEAIQRAAAWTPFPSILGGPASLMLPGGGDVVALAQGIVVWWGVAMVAVHTVSRRALSSMTINGG